MDNQTPREGKVSEGTIVIGDGSGADEQQDTTRRAGLGVKLRFLIADLGGIVLWSYLIVKLFFFDLDAFLIQKYLPGWLWLFNLKFLVFLVLLAFGFLLSRGFLIYVLYVLFYPLVVLLWKIPRLLLRARSWILLFSLVSYVLSFVKNFRFNLASKTLALISIVVIALSNLRTWIVASLFVLALYVAVVVIRTVYHSFKTSEIFAFEHRLINRIRTSEFAKSTMGLEDAIRDKSPEQLEEKQLATYTNNLQIAVMCSELCYYLAYRLEDYRQSRIDTLLNLWAYVGLMFQLVIVFTFVNLGIYRLNHGSFGFTQTPNGFTFLYYSLSNIIAGGIEGLYAVDAAAILSRMMMIVLGKLLFPIVLLNLLFSFREHRANRAIQDTIDCIRREGEEIDRFIKDEYRLTVYDAMNLLVRFDASLISVIDKITSSMPKRRE